MMLVYGETGNDLILNTTQTTINVGYTCKQWLISDNTRIQCNLGEQCDNFKKHLKFINSCQNIDEVHPYNN